ncbi:MAG: hypothetical protein K2N72_01385, partial [Oscillospiraceae bacterium]|nr:hypothetical protein [Oscillospiraceae bacterium]
FILCVTAAAVYISANKIKKLEPITAMRQGIATHNFKKNHLPLEKTSLPVNAALAMKTMLSSFKQNVTVCVTMLVLSLMIVFSGVMFENVIVDMHMFIDIIAGEYADSAISTTLDCEDELISALESDSRVEKFYLYINDYFEVRHVGGDTLTFAVAGDCSKLNNQTMLIEGRFPMYDNEFAIAAKYAKDNGIKVGDELTLEAGSNSDKYIVSGIVQITNNLGKDCIITREGYEKLGELQNVGYFINLTEDTDIDDFNSEISEALGSGVVSTLNINDILFANSKVYIALISAIVAAILIISCIVIIFVMYLLVRTLLGSKKRDYGILKALGFTARQLVVQTALSFMPSVIISSAVGIIISMQIINPLMAVFLSGLGIVKSTFAVPLGFNIIAGIGIDIFAFGAACLMSLRVKKIAPRELLVGE